MTSRLKQLGKTLGLRGWRYHLPGFGLPPDPHYTRRFIPGRNITIEMLNVLSQPFGSAAGDGNGPPPKLFISLNRKPTGRKPRPGLSSGILQWRLIWGSAILLAAMLLWSPLNYLFFKQRLTWSYFILSFSGAFFFQIMSQCVEVFRLLERPWSFLGLELGQTLITAAVILVLVRCDLGILGFWGVLIGAWVAALLGWWQLRDYVSWSGACRSWWPRLLSSAPRWFPICFLSICSILVTAGLSATIKGKEPWDSTPSRQVRPADLFCGQHVSHGLVAYCAGRHAQ